MTVLIFLHKSLLGNPIPLIWGREILYVIKASLFFYAPRLPYNVAQEQWPDHDAQENLPPD